VATISDRVAVMEQGEIVECGGTREIFTSPRQAYTCKLIQSLPIPPATVKAAAGQLS